MIGVWVQCFFKSVKPLGANYALEPLLPVKQNKQTKNKQTKSRHKEFPNTLWCQHHEIDVVKVIKISLIWKRFLIERVLVIYSGILGYLKSGWIILGKRMHYEVAIYVCMACGQNYECVYYKKHINKI